MPRLSSLVLAVVLAHGAVANASELGKLPVIEVVTIGNGSLVWGRHGHITVCVRYGDPHTDRCYHYALADFEHPWSMVAGYFRGDRSFWAGFEAYDNMVHRYRDLMDRSIWVQPLPLTDAQVREFIARLEHDITDDNKYYSYDHFHNNCTTRIRDIIDDVTGHALSTMDEPIDGRSFRDFAREGFFDSRWLELATDLAMGPDTDRVPNYWERMFLPQYLREAIAKRFGVQPIAAYTRRGPPAPSDGADGRIVLMLFGLLAAAPVAVARWRGRFERVALGAAIAPYVLAGGLLAFLATISPLPYVRWNEAILVWLPIDVLLVALRPARRRVYARARVAMLGAIALGLLVGIVKQPLLAPLVWPLAVNTIVGFWPTRERAAAGPAEAAAVV